MRDAGQSARTQHRFMRQSFRCPVCGEDCWDLERTYTYSAQEHHSPDTTLNDYERLRRRVLFEVWCADSETVQLKTRLCRSCGFIAYVPRPSSEALDAKYRFLQEHEQSIGGSAASPMGQDMDHRRAERTYATIRPYIRNHPASVLDFGGGDGKLLAPFYRRGNDCMLVDYNMRPLPGVRKVGDTLDAVPEDVKFDVILCSHVLEHVSDPGQTLRQLARRLTDGGVIYGEVPVEVWRGIPIAGEPVTHVNFFIPGSFEQLFVRSGLRALKIRELRSSYGEAVIDVAVIVAQPGVSDASASANDSAREAKRRLQPDIRMEVSQAWRFIDQVAKQLGALAQERQIHAGLNVLLEKGLNSAILRKHPGWRALGARMHTLLTASDVMRRHDASP